MIYHYTTLETLELILQSKKIRFNRLDRVDDGDESGLFNGHFDLSTYYFISCWTKNPEENLGLWNCYTRNSPGVRIGLPDMPFAKSSLTIKNNRGIRVTTAPGTVVEAFVTIDEMYGRDRFIMSNLIIDNHLEKEIIYLNDEDLKSKYEQFTRYSFEDFQTKGMTMIMDGIETCRYKNKRWAFQEEFRFVLNILPQSSSFLDANAHLSPSSNYIKGVIDCVNRRVKNSILFYDLPITTQSIEYMEVLISPYTSLSEKVTIKESLANYQLKNIAIKESGINIRLS